jgi:hypothetical protein
MLPAADWKAGAKGGSTLAQQHLVLQLLHLLQLGSLLLELHLQL